MSLPPDSVTAVSGELLRNVSDRAAEEPTQDLPEDLTKISWEERQKKPVTQVSDYKEAVQKVLRGRVCIRAQGQGLPGGGYVGLSDYKYL